MKGCYLDDQSFCKEFCNLLGNNTCPLGLCDFFVLFCFSKSNIYICICNISGCILHPLDNTRCIIDPCSQFGSEECLSKASDWCFFSDNKCRTANQCSDYTQENSAYCENVPGCVIFGGIETIIYFIFFLTFFF